MKSKIRVIDLGQTDYKSVWDLQRRIFERRAAGTIGDLLLLNEHRHVYTLGKSADGNHLLAGEDELRATGADLFHIDRGGDITYHGPGQLVGYPILKLDEYYSDVHRYLRELEEVVIRTLSDFTITQARRDRDYTGVWVGSEKIAAIGIKVSRWITMHGFALNVGTDLSYFDRIIPCGIFHKGVTSMEKILGRPVPLKEVGETLMRHFGEIFEAEMEEMEGEELYELLNQQEQESIEWLQ